MDIYPLTGRMVFDSTVLGLGYGTLNENTFTSNTLRESWHKASGIRVHAIFELLSKITSRTLFNQTGANDYYAGMMRRLFAEFHKHVVAAATIERNEIYSSPSFSSHSFPLIQESTYRLPSFADSLRQHRSDLCDARVVSNRGTLASIDQGSRQTYLLSIFHHTLTLCMDLLEILLGGIPFKQHNRLVVLSTLQDHKTQRFLLRSLNILGMDQCRLDHLISLSRVRL